MFSRIKRFAGVALNVASSLSIPSTPFSSHSSTNILSKFTTPAITLNAFQRSNFTTSSPTLKPFAERVGLEIFTWTTKIPVALQNDRYKSIANLNDLINAIKHIQDNSHRNSAHAKETQSIFLSLLIENIPAEHLSKLLPTYTDLLSILAQLNDSITASLLVGKLISQNVSYKEDSLNLLEMQNFPVNTILLLDPLSIKKDLTFEGLASLLAWSNHDKTNTSAQLNVLKHLGAGFIISRIANGSQLAELLTKSFRFGTKQQSAKINSEGFVDFMGNFYLNDLANTSNQTDKLAQITVPFGKSFLP